MNFLQDYLSHFNQYAKEYPMIAGAISLWGLGVLSYLIRGFPALISKYIKRLFTTTIVLTNSNDSFYLFLKWYQLKGYDNKARFLKITNGRYGDDTTLTKSIGYGNHLLWYKNQPIYLVMEQKESASLQKERDELTLIAIGRSHKLFDQLFKDITSAGLDNENSVIKRSSGDRWCRSSEQRPRSFNTVYLQDSITSSILQYLDDFKSRESWYLEKGIPYQAGILLYGPPGTGKTSIIKAIADYLDYQMHILNASSLANIESAMFTLPEKSLVVIEDIDGCNATKRRQSPEPELLTTEPSNDSNKADDIFDFSFANLSDILNAIDGIHQVHGRVLVATTNHIEKLDAALIREGRFDLKIEVGYIDNTTLLKMIENFYGQYKLPVNFKLKEGISTAYVQNLIMKNLNNPEIILDDLNNE